MLDLYQFERKKCFVAKIESESDSDESGTLYYTTPVGEVGRGVGATGTDDKAGKSSKSDEQGQRQKSGSQDVELEDGSGTPESVPGFAPPPGPGLGGPGYGTSHYGLDEENEQDGMYTKDGQQPFRNDGMYGKDEMYGKTGTAGRGKIGNFFSIYQCHH